MNRSRLLWLCALLASLILPPATVPAFARRTVAQKKQIARTHFEDAERMREALKGKPEAARTRRDFTRVIDAYRRVYYIAPTSSKADASALAVGDLMVEYGRAFEDEKSLTNAIGQYEFLRREYPGSRYRFEALFTMGQVYREDIGDNDKARETFNEFLKRYPGHELAEQARQALKEMALEEKGDLADKALARGRRAGKNEPATSESKAEKQRRPATTEATDNETEPSYAQPVSAQINGRRSKLPLVTGIRHWSTPDYTRIAIDLEEEVKYEAGRVPSPDRIFFDLHDTKLASELSGKTFEVGDGLLQKIRVAQFNATLTRVVLEVDTVAEYSAFLLPNPYRLIVDIHGKQPVKTLVAEAKPPQGTPPAPESDKRTDSKRLEKNAGEEKPTEPAAKSSEPPSATTSSTAAATAAKENKPAKAEAVDNKKDPKAIVASRTEPDATKELTEPDSAINRQLKSKENRSSVEPTSSPTVEVVSPRTKPGKRKGKKGAVEDDGPEVRTAQPTASGDRSLIRALGLKIGKIVVDAGHGGHDTGTIGPNGLLEKDLVLDVALRLGKLLESKLGAEVVFTRDDDTFIPLESRTAVANQHQADLFISVHANSSRNPKARGVETYYLNFTSNAEALEVAARENAVSQTSVFELQDLVKKIALKEKIEESREFASNVQNALYAGLAPKGAGLKNRGVKKAPFVVLIGANMPSILAEISFVSNPADEKRLKTGDYRQKIAEALYRGVSRYASGLSGVKAAGKLAEATTATSR